MPYSVAMMCDDPMSLAHVTCDMLAQCFVTLAHGPHTCMPHTPPPCMWGITLTLTVLCDAGTRAPSANPHQEKKCEPNLNPICTQIQPQRRPPFNTPATCDTILLVPHAHTSREESSVSCNTTGAALHPFNPGIGFILQPPPFPGIGFILQPPPWHWLHPPTPTLFNIEAL